MGDVVQMRGRRRRKRPRHGGAPLGFVVRAEQNGVALVFPDVELHLSPEQAEGLGMVLIRLAGAARRLRG